MNFISVILFGTAGVGVRVLLHRRASIVAAEEVHEVKRLFRAETLVQSRFVLPARGNVIVLNERRPAQAQKNRAKQLCR